MEEEQHHTDIKEAPNTFLSGKQPGHKKMYRVVCDCGYVSPWFELKSHAMYDENEHIIAMTR